MPGIRQLAAIMFTDIVGYTALMGKDEQKAFEVLSINRHIHQPLINQYNGTWIKELGDGLLASFPTATDAVLCAHAIKQACKQVPGLQLRIGIHQGEVLFENADVYGDGVNIASRLQAIATAGEIWVSEAVYASIKNKPFIEVAFIGEQTLKNVAVPVKVFEINRVDGAALHEHQTFDAKKISLKKKLHFKKLSPFILGLGVLIIAVSILYFTGIFKNNIQETGIAQSTKNSIAVLPFNMSNDSTQDYFADGMMDEILNHLFKIGGWRIVSRTSVMAFKGSKKTTKEIAGDLNVNYLLEGSVQKEENRVRISVRLINAQTDEQMWGENYEKSFKDLFAIQSDIAQKVAAALKVKINPDVRAKIVALPTPNSEAYTLYLQGKNPSAPNKNLLEKALILDPNFADAYAELAYYWLLQGGWTGKLRREEVLQKALPLLQKALQINPDLASAHDQMAKLQLWYNWDFNAVETEYKNLLQLYPSDPEVTLQFNDYLLSTGRFAEALENAVRNFNNDKNSFHHWTTLAFAYQFNKQPEEALQTLKSAEAIFPLASFLNVLSIRLNGFNDKHRESILAFNRIDSLVGYKFNPHNLGHIAIAYYKTGQKDKAASFINELKRNTEFSPAGSPSFYLAAVYSALGNIDLAFKSLDKAFENHEVEMYWIKVDPLFEPLRGDARFKAIVHKMNFPNISST